MLNRFREFRLQPAFGQRRQRSVAVSEQAKMLVPLAGEAQAAMLADWLTGGSVPVGSELMLLHVVEPRWRREIPYSAARALQMLEEQEALLVEQRLMLHNCAIDLQGRFPDYRISWQVRSDRLTGDSIVSVARDCGVGSILVFTRQSRVLRLIGGSWLVREIVNSADCMVQVFQAVEAEKSEFFSKIGCLTGPV